MKLLNKTQCPCGKDLSQEKFESYKPNLDKEFYGGRVHMTGEITCKCKRKLKGYFTVKDMDLSLIDLEVLKDIPQKETSK